MTTGCSWAPSAPRSGASKREADIYTEREAKSLAAKLSARIGRYFVAIRFGKSWIIARPMKEKPQEGCGNTLNIRRMFGRHVIALFSRIHL